MSKYNSISLICLLCALPCLSYADKLHQIFKDTVLNTATDRSIAVMGDVIRFTLIKGDPLVANHHRSELSHFYKATVGGERFYEGSFRVPYFPPEQIDPVNIMQWHSVDDECDIGQAPPLRYILDGQTIRLLNRPDANECTTTTIPDVELWSHQIEPGRWYKLRTEVKWGYQGANKFIRVYLDDVLVNEVYGGNTRNDNVGPYWKMGLYIPSMNTQPAQAANGFVIDWKDLDFGSF